MWIFWASVAALGSTTWYLAPKFFPTENIFTPLMISGAIGVLLGFIGSRVFHQTWFDPKGIPLGLAFALTWVSTIGLVFAFNSGGKVGPVSVIIELSILLATMVSVIYFREHLNVWQIIGMILTVTGVGLVLFFEK